MKIEFDANRETASASVAMPAFCVEEKRTVLAELLHRINFVTVLGEWKFDPRDGECMMKYTQFIGDTPLSLKQAERMVDISLLSAHMYEETIVPMMMGKEPESDNACSEYKAMMGMDDDHSLLRRMLQQALEAKQKEALEKNSGDSNSAETEE